MMARGLPLISGGRAEHLISGARVVLAATSLLAIWLDPSEPSKYAETAYALLVAYLAYALLILPLAWNAKIRPPQLGIVTHVIDLAAFTLLLYFTEGPTSPFFVYYVFSLFCAALRWQRQGTLWTSLAVLVLFIGQGLFTDLILQDPHFQLNRFIIRSVYLAGVALMLDYLTTYERRTRQDLAKLAAWPHGARRYENMQTLISETLAYAATVMHAPKTLLLWDETEEPFRYLAFLSGPSFQWMEESPETFSPPVIEEFSGLDFICLDAASARPAIVCATEGGIRHQPGSALHPALQARFGMDNSVCLTVQGEQFDGRLFFIGKKDMTDDDLFLGGLVAKQVEAAMSRFYLQQRLQQTASAEAHIRLARDLHDGLLQSLTGIALQLELVRRMPEPDGEAMRKRLGEVQALIVDEQRALRTFIQQLKPSVPAHAGSSQSLQATLNELATGIEQRWGVSVELLVDPSAAGIPGQLADETRYLLNEALSNSAKHAQATLIRASIFIREDQICIHAADNGKGFSFLGRYSLDHLTQMQTGPASLKERISALGGQLTIESTKTGSVVEICFPWQAFSLAREQPGNASQADAPPHETGAH